VPPEVLADASAHGRRRIDRDLCAPLVDGYLRRLASQEARCRLVLGRLAEPFLRRRAQQPLGFVRLDDYARERLGLSGRELQDLARVANGLAGLPALAAAFRAAEISWTHARILVGVATPETEQAWLARARSETVRTLAAGTRADDEEMIDGEPRTRFRLRCPRRVRRRWCEAAELASRMAGARLPAWRAAEVIAAEGLSAAEAGAVPEPAPSGLRAVPRPVSGTVAGEALAEAIPEEVEALASCPEALSPRRLDAHLRLAVRALQRVDFQVGRLLAVVADLRLYRAFGLASLRDYVRARLGFSLRKARALIALDRRVREHPALAEAYRAGRLSLARALVLLPVLNVETADAWVLRAQEVTVRRLVDLVEWALEAQGPEGEPVAPPAAEGRLVLPPLDEVQMRARGLDSEVVFEGPVSVVALLRAAIRAFTPAAAPAWQGFARLVLHARDEWRRQPRHRDPIFERDGWRCAVPACSARSSLHDHHVIYRSHGGDHARDNRVAICAAHHLHGIHGFRIRVAGRAPDDLTWEIGVRRGHPPLFRTHGDRYLPVSSLNGIDRIGSLSSMPS
jgi:hypothetical protein